jgi:hypothetical protein
MQRINGADTTILSMPADTSDSSFDRLKRDADTTRSVPAKPDHGESSASTIIEAPLKRRSPLDAHNFPDGGGSGGAEAFRRTRVKAGRFTPR